ncbi:hypothetical protein SNS2_2450 [Streptomyces netropsis]|nr:hypothetical protein SNS2_2450 [Streptomyces netropsis]
MCLYGVAAREYKRVDVADGENVRQWAAMQDREVHAAAWASLPARIWHETPSVVRTTKKPRAEAWGFLVERVTRIELAL